MKRDLIYFGKPWEAQSATEQARMRQLLNNRKVVLVVPASHGVLRPMPNSANRPDNLIQIVQEPGHHLPLLREISRFLFTRKLLQLMQEQQIRSPILWLNSPEQAHFIGTLGEHKVIYYYQNPQAIGLCDDHSVDNRQEAELIKKVDLILTEDILHAFRFPSHKTTQLCNVTTPMTTRLPRPRDLPHGRAIAGFYGPIDDRLDWSLLKTVATLRPDWHWVLLGPDMTLDSSQQLHELLQLKNVFWLGEKTVAETQAYIQHWQLLMLPYLTDKKSLSTLAKMNEYLALDKPVVMTTGLQKPSRFMPLCSQIDSARTFAELLPMIHHIPESSNGIQHRGWSWGQEFIGQHNEPWTENLSSHRHPPAMLDTLIDSLA
jgi:hypothetical protein